MRLSLKFTLLLLGLLAVTLGATGWMLVRHQRRAVQDQALQRARTVASLREASRAVAQDTSLPPAARKHAESLLAAELARAQLEHAFAVAPLEPGNEGVGEQFGFRALDGQEQFYLARPIVTPSGESTSVAIVSVPTDELRAQQQAVWWRIVALFVAVGALMAGGAWLAFHHLVDRRLQRAVAVLDEVAEDATTPARLDDESSDELGQLAQAVNDMLDKVLPVLQQREAEHAALQASICKLLEQVSGVGEGDLTREAEVTADATGAIADSFNYTIEQLRVVIGNVQDATRLVSTQATEVRATAAHMVHGTETQAEQIVNTSSALEEMSTSIQQVSDNAAVSATVAQQALANARTGNEAVQNTIRGMDRIRAQAQETAKRIKRLGESSQEIGQITQLIDDIADRTSILALNASIQAAMAGEAGRGFAVVAGEVERLAERSTEATKKIAMLVKTIQGETSEASSAMEKGIQDVVEGSQLANQAGRALVEIESVSNRLAELIQSISLASRQQARSSESLSQAMGDISRITQQTAAGTRQASSAFERLAALVQELRNSVSTFKLPPRTGDVLGQAPVLTAESSVVLRRPGRARPSAARPVSPSDKMAAR
jgi:twitching motility protein PilJ